MLPKNLQYGSKVESASAKSYTTNIQPVHGTGIYRAGDTITIEIPTRKNLVFVPSESYLKFNVAFLNGNTTNDYIRLDSCGAHGLIQRIKVFHGVNELSNIDNYGLLAKIMFDIQVPTDSIYGKYSILAGTRSDQIAFVRGNNGNYSVINPNSGLRITESGIFIGANAQSPTKTFCINLISLVGTLCDKYFPLYACTSNPLRIEIQLTSSPHNGACSQTSLSSFQISNCEYVAQMIELSDASIGLIKSSLNGNPLQFVNHDYKNYTYNAPLQSTTTQITMCIPATFSSLKSIFAAIRDSSKIGIPSYFPYSCNKFGILNYNFKIGRITVPSKMPETLPEMFSEVCKAIGSMSDLTQQPSINVDSYTQNLALPNDDTVLNPGSVSSGAFYVGLDLENYTNSDKSSIYAGFNSNNEKIYFVPTFSPQIVPVASARFDVFAMFDSLLIFENNTCYVKF
jgi:hypothetical protein